jgi:type VI secretion system protein ImpG
MSETLHHYYERELVFIRQLAQEFAKLYPKSAGLLQLEPNRATDPHVERLIESFAFLTGRIQHKLDDELPELTDALLGVLYPHYQAPIPSMAIVQLELTPGAAQSPQGVPIAAHSVLATPEVEYQREKRLKCHFRTCYPVTLWPIRVAEAALRSPPPEPAVARPDDAVAALRLQLEYQGEFPFAGLSLDRLRFFLKGDNQLVADLYELLFSDHVQRVVFRSLDSQAPPVVLKPEECLGQVGFGPYEGLLPYPPQSFIGYRLLTEFFAFPAKFLFVDLSGWDRLRRAGFHKKVEVTLYLDRTLTSLEHGVNATTFRLGCTPIINLFKKNADPIALTHSRFEYRIIPDGGHPRGHEVYSVQAVTSLNQAGETREYQPFYSFRHGTAHNDGRAFWCAARRASLLEDDRGTEVYLSLVDLDFDPRLPADAVLTVETTCLNRDLPTRLQQAGEELAFHLEKVAPVAAIRCLHSPTLTLRPPLRRGAYWRLLSHLNLNHLSLADEEEGRMALQEMLRLYDFSDPQAGQQLQAVNRNLIDGILGVKCRSVVGRTGTAVSSGFARGTEVTVELDEQKYLGTGAFLFARVLEQFLGLYVSMNSFSQMIGKTKQRGVLKKWPPRAGAQPLL